MIELFGAHNHDVVGAKIQLGPIRKRLGIKSFNDLPDDIPFKLIQGILKTFGTGLIFWIIS